MPRVAQVAPLKTEGWVGGLNRQADPFQLEMTESPDCLNVDFGLRGAVGKRDGYSKYSTVDGSSGVLNFMARWRSATGNDLFVAADAAGNQWHMTATTLVSSGLGANGAAATPREYAFSQASMGGSIYLTSLRNGTLPTAKKFDGTTWTSVVATNFDGTAARFPLARSLTSAYSRVFAFNVRTGAGTNHRSRVYWSGVLLPETWAALDYIDVSPDDGQEITYGGVFGETIVIFKDRSMYLLQGYSSATFALVLFDSKVGTTAPGTIVNAGTEMMFFDPATGVWSFDGSRLSRHDDKISDYLLNNVNHAAIEKSTGFVYQGRYFLCVPWQTSTVPNKTFVLDPRIGAWSEYDVAWTSATQVGGTMYAGGVRNLAGVDRMWHTQADRGASITSYFATPWMAPITESVKHRIRRLDLAFSAIDVSTVTVDMRRDFSLDAYRSKGINVSPGGFIWGTSLWGVHSWGTGVSEVLSRTTGWGDRWRVCQLVFRENGTGTYQVNRMSIQLSTLQRSRGAY